MTSKRTPVEDRIASFHLNDISLLAGDINEFCVSLNYDFTTDNDSYVNPAHGAKGKGTWPDNYMEIRIKRVERNKYEIISIGTGAFLKRPKSLKRFSEIPPFHQEQIESPV